jgi:hypothetical protein
MLTTKQSLLDAIETAPDDVLEDLLGHLKSRLQSRPNPQRRQVLGELQKICQEEDYCLEIIDRSDRPNPFIDGVEHVSL